MIKRIIVRFTRDVRLPRFNKPKNSQWQVRVDRLQKDGFTLGGGFIHNDDYEVVGWK